MAVAVGLGATGSVLTAVCLQLSSGADGLARSLPAYPKGPGPV